MNDNTYGKQPQDGYNPQQGYNPQYGQGNSQGYNPQYGQGNPQGYNPQYGQGNPQGYNPQYDQGNSQSAYDPQGWSNRPEFTGGAPVPPKKKSKKKLAIILGCTGGAVVVAAALAAIFLPKLLIGDKERVLQALGALGQGMSAENPASVLSAIDTKALSEQFDKSAMAVDAKLEIVSLLGDGMEGMGLSAEGFTIELDIAQDMVNKRLSGSMDVGYMDAALFSGDLYADEENFCIAVPDFYEGYLRLPTENILSAYNQSYLGRMDPVYEEGDFSLNLFSEDGLTDEITAISEELLEKTKEMYEQITVEKADSDREFDFNGKSKKAKKYEMTLPKQEISDLLVFVVEEVASNEAFLAAYGLESGDFGEMLYMLDQLIAEDVVLDVYLVDSKVAGFEAETVLDFGDGSLMDFAMEMAFEDSDAYNQCYEGGLYFRVDGEEMAITFEKDTENEASDAASEFLMNISVPYSSSMDYSFLSSYDKESGDFSYDLSFYVEGETIALGMNGNLGDVQAGKAFDMDIDEMYLSAANTSLTFAGEVAVEPMSQSVEEPAGQVRDLFSMTESDFEALIMEIYENLGLY